jgi:uncharacterized protein YjgD (DUF1641 family)
MNKFDISLYRIKELMNIKEEIINQSEYEKIIQGDLSSLKQFLSTNNDFTGKLIQLMNVSNKEELLKKLEFPNKTSIMKIMQQLSQDKDMETYKFLDSVMKNSGN